MSHRCPGQRNRLLFGVAAISLAAAALLLAANGETVYAKAGAAGAAQAGTNSSVGGSPGQLADTCLPPAGGANGPAARPPAPGAKVYTPETYPVKLPPMSLLGARNDLPNPFKPGVHWGKLPEGRRWGSTAGVYASPDGKTIWAIDRCGEFGAGGKSCDGSPFDPILQFDLAGNLLQSFGKGMMVSPHKIHLDQEGNVWVTDNVTANGKGQTVFKFSDKGKLLLTLGKPGVAGPGLDEFDQPTDVAVAPNGDIFVADGHAGFGQAVGNARIMKFDKNGKFLKTWGRTGMAPGEFNTIHALAMDSRGRLFVADRQNNRIQIFDQDGKFIAQWFQFSRPSGIFIDKNDVIYVTDSESRDGYNLNTAPTIPPTGYSYNAGARRGIRIGSAKDGSVKSFIPDACPWPPLGYASMAEGVTADAEGNVYGADFLETIRKFVKK